MLLSKVTSFGSNQITKPIYLVSLATLTVSLVFTSLILTGCTSPTPGVRKFTLITLTYGEGSKSASFLKKIDDVLDGDKGSTTFKEVRVGYRGVCIKSTPKDSEDSEWTCGPKGESIFGSDGLGGDPIDLVGIADVYKDKISFSLPLIVAIILLGLSWVCVALNMLPIPIWGPTRTIGAATGSLGALLLCGSMVLHYVTTSAVNSLVDRLGVGAVNIDIGNAITVFGWTSFALAAVAAVGTGAVAVKDLAIKRAERYAEEMAERGLGKASGGRVNMDDLRQFQASADAGREQGRGFVQGGFSVPKKPAEAVSLATKLLRKGQAMRK